MEIRYEIIDFETKRTMGIPLQLTQSQTDNHRRIGDHWVRFNKTLANTGYSAKGSWEKFSLTYRYNGILFYMPSVPAQLPDKFTPMTIPEGLYAKFQNIGPMQNLITTYHNIYKKFLPNNQLQIDPDRSFLHFERYDYRFHWNRSDSIIEIFIPILSANRFSK